MAINYHNVGQELNKADYIVRILAFLIDIILLSAFTVLVNLLMVASSYIYNGTAFWISIGYHFCIMLMIVFISCGLYSVIAVATSGATIGKHLMRIEVVTIKGRDLTLKQIICREFIGRTICKITLFSGFAMMFYNEDGFGFHDKLAGTMVVKKGEDLMELAVGKEIIRNALKEGEDAERYNRIYNRGINAKLSGGNMIMSQPIQQEFQQMNMSYHQNVVQPYGMPVQYSNQYVQPQNGMTDGYNANGMYNGVQQPNMMEVYGYQEALQSVVDEHSLMDECQQHVQFYS